MPRLIALLLLLVPTFAFAQAPVEYAVAFPNLVHHEAEIAITYRDLPAEPLEIRMSRSSPGRYALHEFAKNVYSVSATTADGRPLQISRPNPHQWDVAGHDGTVVFRYTLYGNRADGTYTGIDASHAHLNMPATFAWARGLEERPIEISFERPVPGWQIATQLVPTTDPDRFTAPDLQYFLDSPVEISDLDVREWEIGSGETRQTIRLAVHHTGGPAEVDAYEALARRVVDEQIAIFREAPDFDYGDYIFIACYTPWVAGDGMEHRNSTILTSTRPLSTGAVANLGTLSHEFIHAWSVERLRPRSLEPFDFERANMSPDLWFAEGFTSYYTNYIIRRAGIVDDEAYAGTLTGMLNTVLNSPGRRYFSPVEMSMQAPFVDAATSVDPQNRENTFISYYTWGAMIGLGLDLTLRDRFDLTLDDYMAALWRDFGRDEIPYTQGDLRSTLASITGDATFAADFFSRYIDSGEVVDYERLLARAGYLLRPANPGMPWVGLPRVQFGEAGARVLGNTLVDSPLYEAGIAMGDLILTLDGRRITAAEDVAKALRDRRPGDQLEVTFEQLGVQRTEMVVLGEDPRIEVVPYEAAGRELDAATRQFRAEWLGSRVGR